MRTDASNDSASSPAYSFVTSRCSRIDSLSWLPIFMTGFSEVIGSWNTIAICAPQNLRISASERPTISLPSNRTEPRRVVPRLGRRFMIERDSTVFPEPDSPTIPNVFPRSSVNDTPSTDRTAPP